MPDYMVALETWEPHCDCNDGFKMSDGECIPEATEETENPPFDGTTEMPPVILAWDRIMNLKCQNVP